MTVDAGAMPFPAKGRAVPADDLRETFAPEILANTAFWLHEFSKAWHSEVPIKIHSGLRYIDDGGAPAFTPDFAAYIDRPCRRQRCYDLHCQHDAQSILEKSPRHRTTRAFRRLKEFAPREFDALYLVCRHGLSLAEVAVKLTERAVRLDKPERYGSAAVLILVMSGIDKVQKFW